jgi:DNA-binding transcriptional LysR family regulator
MDRLDAMAAFVAAVEEGSLAGAARRLGWSAAALTRAVAALEARLGMPLLVRSTRALHLTAFGQSYIETCRQVLGALDAAERGAAAEHDQPRGLLTLTAPLLFGRLRLRPVLDRFLDANPAVTARLLLLDRVVSLIDEGLDAAIRLAHLPDSSLIATRLGEVGRLVCASPAYLDRHGTPRKPADLLAHACMTSSPTGAAEAWRFGAGPDDRQRGGQTLAVRPRLSANGSAAPIDSALEGRGITQVLAYQVEAHLQAGRLVPLLSAYAAPPLPVHLVYPEAQKATAKLRAFIGFAAPLLRDDLSCLARVVADAVARAG